MHVQNTDTNYQSFAFRKHQRITYLPTQQKVHFKRSNGTILVSQNNSERIFKMQATITEKDNLYTLVAGNKSVSFNKDSVDFAKCIPAPSVLPSDNSKEQMLPFIKHYFEL